MDVESFIYDSTRMTTRELAKRYNISERTARRWKSKNRESNFPDPVGEVFDKYATIKSDRTLIIGDIECPNHDTQTLENALAISCKFELDTLIINGDLISLDSFSTWARATIYGIAFKEELAPTIQILKVFLSHFNRIFINSGNHERRLARKLEGEITIGDFFTNLTGVTYSEYSYCFLESGGKTIFVAHQDNYSRIPLSVAREMAAIKHTNIICGHTHILSQSRDRSGKYWIVDGGSARSPERTMYKAIRTNTFPEWQLGFVMVINGVPFLIDNDHFDFYVGEQGEI